MRNYEQAAHWTQTAIDLVTASGLPRHERARWLAEMTLLLDHLRRKPSRSHFLGARDQPMQTGGSART